MYYYPFLQKLEAENNPVRVGIIGMGRFSTMYAANVKNIPGMRIVAVADINVQKAYNQFELVGWPKEQVTAPSIEQAAKTGGVCLLDDGEKVISSPFIDIVVEATGIPSVAIRHALLCCEHKKHLIMVSIEGDVVAGPLLKRMFDNAGLIYSLAYGDQPAEAVALVDWAKTCGFEVVAAGEYRKYFPGMHQSTPETVFNGKWVPFMNEEYARKNNLNPKMFNSFADGTKGAIEICAISNATGLETHPEGSHYAPAAYDEISNVMRPISDGGILPKRGMVDVVSNHREDGSLIEKSFSGGIFVTYACDGNDYQRDCYKGNSMCPTCDTTGKYVTSFIPAHHVGLELSLSVAHIATIGSATGSPSGFISDVAAISKRDLAPGEILDGEGGFTVYGEAIPAAISLEKNAVPLGLCDKVKLFKPVKAGTIVSWDDIDYDKTDKTVQFRKQMEKKFGKV